jgi:glycosyltransferase involved in cell wall biosynthesis
MTKTAGKIILYYRQAPEKDRFIFGDRWIRPLIRRLIRGKKIGGIEKVFLNLKKSFDILNISYEVNIPFKKIQKEDRIIILGRDKFALHGYNKPNKIIAGIGLMTHPSEWPNLFNEYPIAKYLQHSEWTNNVYIPYYGRINCALWPAGIETEKWKPNQEINKEIDFLVYNKINWEKEKNNTELRNPILKLLSEKGLSYVEIVYGNYKSEDYRMLLAQSKAMIFLSEHESQGFACNEAMSMDIPILAWDQGFCQDPNRFKWGQPNLKTSSVPFFNDDCGLTFKNFKEFKTQLDLFLVKKNKNQFKPRAFVLANLSLEKSGERMLQIIKEVYES